jgi:hypothetical protein
MNNKVLNKNQELEVINGITLCKFCHKEVHSKKDMNYMKYLPRITNQYTTVYE